MITYSSGNHGLAVAMVARVFGLPAVVVMPETAPHVKVEGIKQVGGEVIFAARGRPRRAPARSCGLTAV